MSFWCAQCYRLEKSRIFLKGSPPPQRHNFSLYELGNPAAWGQEPQPWRGVPRHCLFGSRRFRSVLATCETVNVIKPTWVLRAALLTARVGNAAARQQPDAVPNGIYWASAPRGLNVRQGLRLGSRVIQNNSVWALPEGSYSADRMVFLCHDHKMMLESEEPHAAGSLQLLIQQEICYGGAPMLVRSSALLRGLPMCRGCAACPCRKSSNTLINLGHHVCSGSEPMCFDPTSDKPHVLRFVTRRTSWECSLHLRKTYHQQEHYLQLVVRARPDKSDKNADFSQHYLHPLPTTSEEDSAYRLLKDCRCTGQVTAPDFGLKMLVDTTRAMHQNK